VNKQTNYKQAERQSINGGGATTGLTARREMEKRKITKNKWVVVVAVP
jgi:hypothetical protein